MSTLTQTISFTSEEYKQNPYPTYDRVREISPVFKLGEGIWLITKYSIIKSALRDDRSFGKTFKENVIKRYGEAYFEQPIFQTINRFMLGKNAPDHTHYRKLINPAFTIPVIEKLRPRIEKSIDDAISQFANAGEADLIKDFAHPLPLKVIFDLMNIPDKMRNEFLHEETISVAKTIEMKPLSKEELEEANQAVFSFEAFFKDTLEERKKNPGDDLISLLLQPNEKGERLKDEEVLANIIFLFIAGHDTTVSLIGNGLNALLNNPEQLKTLRDGEVSIQAIVEEILRYDTPVQSIIRNVMNDIELEGFSFKKGEMLFLSLGAANRDPEMYQHPNEFNPKRNHPAHLSFGGGQHFCIGAYLSRLETEVAITKLLERIPRLKDQSNIKSEVWRSFLAFRGLQEFGVKW